MSLPTPPLAASHLGQGIKYPLEYDGAGKLKLSSGLGAVNEALQSIIRTAPGERVMLPDYGANTLLFEPYDLERFRVYLQTTLINFESRITAISVDADLNETQVGQVIVTIEYRVAEDATPRTLTYPFFVGPT